LVVKGIMTAEDAVLAVDHGIAGIVVSNHGGRQLDSTLGSLDALPEVFAAVRGRIEVYLDGGIRRGTDVLKALALGAKAVFVGRPVLWVSPWAARMESGPCWTSCARSSTRRWRLRAARHCRISSQAWSYGRARHSPFVQGSRSRIRSPDRCRSAAAEDARGRASGESAPSNGGCHRVGSRGPRHLVRLRRGPPSESQSPGSRRRALRSPFPCPRS